ncbi:MAG TPA: hypothetical protein VGL22_02775 [Terracidiphilus sp.]|jgi:hypothetical protein
MLHIRIHTLLLSACLLSSSLINAHAQVASDAELATIAARGRVLYEYDQAAWHASDAAAATLPRKEQMAQYIARKTAAGWEVAFGQISSSGDAFLIAVLAKQGKSIEEFTAKKFDQPQRDTGFYLSASKGIRAATSDFGGMNRLYNVAAVPATNGQLYVYLVPAQTDEGDYPLGADVRYLVAADGKIINKRPLHKGLIPHGDVPPGTKMAGGTHSHVLSNVPEDTDVFYVLTRKPSMPEYISTQTAVYCVNADGSIKVAERVKSQH